MQHSSPILEMFSHISFIIILTLGVSRCNEVLHIRVLSGRGLSSQELSGREPNPFVFLTLGETQNNTRVLSSTSNPTWNQELTLPIITSFWVRLYIYIYIYRGERQEKYHMK